MKWDEEKNIEVENISNISLGFTVKLTLYQIFGTCKQT